MRELSVTATDGIVLSARVGGVDDGPTVVLVHGFPDSSQLWDRVVDRLGRTHRVVTYDVRGAGASQAPAQRDGYRFEQLADDLVAVADATSPDAPVHVVGHDWGAIQTFEAATSAAHAHRLASFTCIGGASFDHAGRSLRRNLRRRRPGPVGGQLRRSWYMLVFQLPLLPELVLRSPLGPRIVDRLEPVDGPPAATFPRDAANGVNLYRANLGRVLSPERSRVLVPVQVVIGTRDPFVSDALFEELPTLAHEAWLRRVDGGHWLPRTHPDEVVDAVRDLITHVEDGVTSASLDRARLHASGT